MLDVVAIVCGIIGGKVTAMLFAPNGPTISRLREFVWVGVTLPACPAAPA